GTEIGVPARQGRRRRGIDGEQRGNQVTRWLSNLAVEVDACAVHGKLTARFENAKAQIAGVVLGIANGLIAFETFPAETRNRSAGIDDAPEVSVVACRDFYPIDEVGFRRLNVYGVVKGSLFPDLQHHLRVLAGSVAVFAKGYGARLAFCMAI